eukprot:4294003-Pyramimonas_sp.AAC.1
MSERGPVTADLHAERLVGDGQVALDLVHVPLQRGVVDGPHAPPPLDDSADQCEPQMWMRDSKAPNSGTGC